MSALILNNQTTYVEDAVFLWCGLCGNRIRTPNDTDGQPCNRCKSYQQNHSLSAILPPETMDFAPQKNQFSFMHWDLPPHSDSRDFSNLRGRVNR